MAAIFDGKNAAAGPAQSGRPSYNVAKHAHASRVDVVLSTTGDRVVLVVEDDSAGFDAVVNATLDVESVPEKGTAVFLRAPVSQARQGGQVGWARWGECRGGAGWCDDRRAAGGRS